ncbi:MAG: anaerobic sulfatase maturase [Arcanobacterium sp.]|nr:anaerobic sulfatase maturase [Arcanobacterium sp.]
MTVSQRGHIPLSVVTKPTGSACNLDCAYCFFLSKELLYNQQKQRMSEQTLRTYIHNFLDTHPDGDVTLLWQGGEPTLRGIDFFQKAVEIAEELRRPHQQVHHAIQTNATLVNEEWARFFAKHDFLVGVSIDGPSNMHDTYRVNRAGRATHSMVIRGWEILQRSHVRCNILCTVHAANEDYPLEVYRYFRDDLGAEYLQFIPIVERIERRDIDRAERGWRETGLLYQQQGDAVTSRSVTPEKYGAFLTTIFNEWIENDVGRVFVQDFDAALGAVFGVPTVCVHAPECGNNLAMEFNGDVYACDHWVEPDWKLGNVSDASFLELVQGETMRRFAKKKNSQLPALCRQCTVRRFCNGGCPKDRFVELNVGAGGSDLDQETEHMNYLCAGYKSFFTAIRPDVIGMARLLRRGRTAAEIMDKAVRAKVRPAS